MKQTLQKLINESRRNKDKDSLSAYQSVVAAIQERENRENKILSEEEIFSTIEKEAKKYEESGVAFKGRPQEEILKKQANLLRGLLPKKIDVSEYDDIVDGAIKDLGVSDMRGMGAVMTKIKDKFGISLDMARVSVIVREKLRK